MIRLALLLAPLLAAAPASAAAPAGDARPQRGPRRGLTHPLLDIEPGKEFHELKPFRYRVEKEIADLKKAGVIVDASFYFRDLDNGLGIGIDTDRPFKPASLLKLPILFAILNAAESDPQSLDRRLTVPVPAVAREQYFKPLAPLEQGKEYSTKELLRAMIVGSDNGAASALLQSLPKAQYLSVFSDLELAIPDLRGVDDPVTTQEYATFFRILYNASYLDRGHSQYALELLAAAEFKRGLASGVPANVVVAHKFGEALDSDGLKQLHDCGIVYRDPSPYLICVMTRGKDIDLLADAVARISGLVYREVDAQARRSGDLIRSRHERKPGAPAGRDR